MMEDVFHVTKGV